MAVGRSENLGGKGEYVSYVVGVDYKISHIYIVSKIPNSKASINDLIAFIFGKMPYTKSLF